MKHPESNIPESWYCIGGPITRPEDEKEVAIYVDMDAPEDMLNIHVDNGYRGSVWGRDEVRSFGKGDFREGVSAMLGLLATASIESLEDAGRYPPLP